MIRNDNQCLENSLTKHKKDGKGSDGEKKHVRCYRKNGRILTEERYEALGARYVDVVAANLPFSRGYVPS